MKLISETLYKVKLSRELISVLYTVRNMPKKEKEALVELMEEMELFLEEYDENQIWKILWENAKE